MDVSSIPSKCSNAAISIEETPASLEARFPVQDYDLAATLSSGQAFRWTFRQGTWIGVIGRRWVQLHSEPGFILAATVAPLQDWDWLTHYLQTRLDLNEITATFPDDPPLRAALNRCRGLRLLRQEPWECLASFILSSTKQIVQIRQIVALLCERFGEPIPTPPGHAPAFSFPVPERLARLSESDLRACKMGFRAPYLLETARIVANGRISLQELAHQPVQAAREALMTLPGVGRKIADCVLLFAYGFQSAFPMDVWVMKAFRDLYFARKRPSTKRLRHFSETHFGPNAGYAQQYLFHYIRTRMRRPGSEAATGEIPDAPTP